MISFGHDDDDDDDDDDGDARRYHRLRRRPCGRYVTIMYLS